MKKTWPPKFSNEKDFLKFLNEHKFESAQVCSTAELCQPESSECTIAICKYIKQVYKQIPPEEREQFYYVEVGVKFGRTFAYVLDFCRANNIQVKAFAIDLFEDFTVEQSNTHKGDVANAQEFEQVLVNKGFTNVTVIKGDSHECLKKIPDMKWGVGFIDGNHTYDYVKGDYNLLLAKMKKGFIVLDDICPYWMGVHRFWNELPKAVKVETIGKGWEVKGVARIL